MREKQASVAWWALCLLHAAPGVAGLVAPMWFATELAGISTQQPHFARDVGVAELTLAAAAALAALRPATRRPVAGVLTLHLVLHAVSHVADHGAADAAANVLITATLAVQAALLTVGCARTTARPRPNEQAPVR